MAKHRTIDVKAQVNLPLIKTFRLCVGGISHRLLRSVLTLAVVVMAVAFFMFLLAESMFVGSTARGVASQVTESRLASSTLTYLFEFPASLMMSRRLASAVRDEPAKLTEYAAVTEWQVARVEALAGLCDREQSYLDFFEDLPIGNRLVLVHKHRGRDIFRLLDDGAERAGFAERLEPMLDIELPGGMDGFAGFLDVFPAFETELKAFTGTWRESVESLRSSVTAGAGHSDFAAWVRELDETAIGDWVQDLRERGFDMDTASMLKVRDQLRELHLEERVSKTLNTDEKADGWIKAFKQTKRITLAEKLLLVGDERAIRLLGDAFTRDELKAVAERASRQKRLTDLTKRLSGKVETGVGGGLTARQVFLLLISFVVCMVGIANAMLMSITERFREIATMKCLGATDRYILVQFMMEAGIQGVAGGVAGMLIGFLIALVKNSGSFGATLYAYWPGIPLVWCGAASLAAGVLLAVLASIYPSWSASRMVPMEAMRVE